MIDYTALTDPVQQSDVDAWRRQAKASGASWASLSPTTIGALIVGGFGAVVLLMFFSSFRLTFDGASMTDGAVGILRFAIVAVVAGIIAIAVRRWMRGGGPWTRRYRLARFAQANGMAYSPAQGDPNYPGMIFTAGRNREALDHLDTTTGRFLDIGNYRWVTGSGKEQTTHTWGFLALSLDRAMPNIVLDSRANNTILGSNLPVALDRNQVLHLEGDFDRSFTLYCPKEYERDALVIFTPDLMAQLIDEAAPFDVELVDSWMFVYSSKPFTMTDPATLQRLFRIADTVGATAVHQTQRYADDRVGDFSADVVTPQGARLKRGAPLVGGLIAAVVAVVGVIWSSGLTSQLLSTLTGR